MHSEFPTVLNEHPVPGTTSIPRSELHPAQIRAWKQMQPGEKWSLALQANHLLRESVRNRIRRQSPQWSEEQINQETSRALLFHRT